MPFCLLTAASWPAAASGAPCCNGESFADLMEQLPDVTIGLAPRSALAARWGAGSALAAGWGAGSALAAGWGAGSAPPAARVDAAAEPPCPPPAAEGVHAGLQGVDASALQPWHLATQVLRHAAGVALSAVCGALLLARPGALRAAAALLADAALLWWLFASIDHMHGHLRCVLAAQLQQHTRWRAPQQPQQQHAPQQAKQQAREEQPRQCPLRPWLLLAAVSVDVGLLLVWALRQRALQQGQALARLVLRNAAAQLACIAAKLLLLWALQGSRQAAQQPLGCSQAAEAVATLLDRASRLCCAALPLPLWTGGLLRACATRPLAAGVALLIYVACKAAALRRHSRELRASLQRATLQVHLPFLRRTLQQRLLRSAWRGARHAPVAAAAAAAAGGALDVAAAPVECCAICREGMADPLTLGCGHRFCVPCLAQWVSRRTRATCPLCRHGVHVHSGGAVAAAVLCCGAQQQQQHDVAGGGSSSPGGCGGGEPRAAAAAPAAVVVALCPQLL